MARSLRVRLQLWHAAILLLVITTFGTAFYLQLERSLLGEIDTDLLSNARVLEGALRALPLGPSGPSRPRFDGPGNPRPPRPGFMRSQPGIAPDDRLWRTLDLPQTAIRGPHEAPVYFAVFTERGEIVRQVPAEREFASEFPEGALQYRRRGPDRELLMRGPHNTVILVGRDVQGQMDRLGGWLAQLLMSGGLVFALGLAGGWWLSGTAIRPIKSISRTASQISASNLVQRIETQHMDQELLDLGTVLNSMLERIEHAFVQQTQFTADASHELRTPLAVLLSHCELALSRQRSAAEYQNTLATCQRAGRRMQGLVEDLLVLARHDAGRLELHKQDVDLQTLAAEAKTLFQPLADEHQVDIVVGGTSALVHADERRLAQVLANLVGNAIQYNRPGGSIEIAAGSGEDWASVSVRDTGCGISADDLPHLFDRFYRVDQARSRESGGSGLGLAICKSIVEAHQGRIVVESQVATGSSFEVRLPKKPAHV